MKLKIIFVVVVLLGIGSLLWQRKSVDKPVSSSGAVVLAPKTLQKNQSRQTAPQRGERSTRSDTLSDPNRVESDAVNLEKLQSSLDDEDFLAVRSIARKLMHSPSAEVRSEAIEALRWFRTAALPELRSMLGDVDPNVAEDASEAWRDAVDGIVSEDARAKELYLGMLQTRDADELGAAVMGFYEIDDGLAIGYIVQLIGSGNLLLRQVGLDAYEHITGDSYVGNDAAKKWIDEWRAENPLVDDTEL